MSDDDLKFRLPVKCKMEISGELYLRLAEHGAKLPVPMSVERLVETVLIAYLDSHRKATWPPEPERRCTKPN